MKVRSTEACTIKIMIRSQRNRTCVRVRAVELVPPVEVLSPVELVSPVELLSPVELVPPVELLSPVELSSPVLEHVASVQVTAAASSNTGSSTLPMLEPSAS